MKNIFTSILAVLCLTGYAFGQSAGNYETIRKGVNYIDNAGIAFDGTYSGLGAKSSGTNGVLVLDGTLKAAGAIINGVAIGSGTSGSGTLGALSYSSSGIVDSGTANFGGVVSGTGVWTFGTANATASTITTGSMTTANLSTANISNAAVTVSTVTTGSSTTANIGTGNLSNLNVSTPPIITGTTICQVAGPSADLTYSNSNTITVLISGTKWSISVHR